MLRIPLLLVTILLSFNCYSQTYWRVENERGEELLLTIQINSSNSTFETHTRKDALKEMAGSFMYMMAKTAGKIKYPEMMHGEGKISGNADTTFYNGNIDYPDKVFVLKAKTWKNNFYGLLTDNKNRTSILTGEQVSTDKPLRDYPALINNAFLLTEKYYWDAGLLKSSDWKNFKEEINDLKLKIADDYEMGMILMWLGKKLNQVPHEIRKINKRDIYAQQKKNSPIRYISTKKAILSLNNIPESKEETDLLFKDIMEKNTEVLILDAFGNRNLSLNSALNIASHLNSPNNKWGYYLTRKWSETESALPQAPNYERVLKNSFELSGPPNKNFSEKGFYLKSVPGESIFKGKVYLVINKWTMNVAEAFAIYLKNEKIATLVGQKSAGSPVLTNLFEIDKLYRISIPIAQFYDKNGKCYQGIGIEPDLVTEQDPVVYILKL